jgi:hypothetical protein
MVECRSDNLDKTVVLQILLPFFSVSAHSGSNDIRSLISSAGAFFGVNSAPPPSPPVAVQPPPVVRPPQAAAVNDMAPAPLPVGEGQARPPAPPDPQTQPPVQPPDRR